MQSPSPVLSLKTLKSGMQSIAMDNVHLRSPSSEYERRFLLLSCLQTGVSIQWQQVETLNLEHVRVILVYSVQ